MKQISGHSQSFFVEHKGYSPETSVTIIHPNSIQHIWLIPTRTGPTNINFAPFAYRYYTPRVRPRKIGAPYPNLVVLRRAYHLDL